MALLLGSENLAKIFFMFLNFLMVLFLLGAICQHWRKLYGTIKSSQFFTSYMPFPLGSENLAKIFFMLLNFLMVLFLIGAVRQLWRKLYGTKKIFPIS
jgi:hypothetical protein